MGVLILFILKTKEYLILGKSSWDQMFSITSGMLSWVKFRSLSILLVAHP